jgi:outer membrane lipopolysaccharide assembly protein LptE/RlpB
MRTERFFDFDENDVQSKNEEAQLLKKEMTDDLVRQIIRRLNAISNRSNTSTSDATDTTTK